MNTEEIMSAHGEWDYRFVSSQQFPEREWATSIPCQLRFTGDIQQDTELLHEVLEKEGFTPFSGRADRKATEGRPWYDGEIVISDKYYRICIRVFRGNVVRLYPYDEYVPTVDELTALVRALEVGFGAQLEHDPIERSGKEVER